MALLSLIETIQTKLSTLTKKDGQLIVVRDNASLYIDLDGNRIYVSDWIDVNTDADRLAMLSPLSNKYYYVIQDNKIWRYIGGTWTQVTKHNASDIVYNNTNSGLDATTIQGAIDDINAKADGLAEELAKLDDALIWQGAISGDDWVTAPLGVWNTTTANETYNIPAYSVIYKPRPTNFYGAFVNCYATGEQRGVYAYDDSTKTFVRLPRINELDSKLSKSGGQITGKITTSVENVSYETNGNIYSPIYGGNLYDYLVIHNTAINNNQSNVNDLITRFPKTCCYVPNNDWNNAVENGFYMASGASNAPGTGWYMGIVIVHNANWVVQEVWEFTGGSDTLVCRKLVRHCREGKWTAWANPPVQFATKNAALYTDANGNVAASASVTATELGYLDGVTSSIQTQLNNKAGLGTQPYFGGVTVGGNTSQAYIYSEGENINFRYKNSAGTVAYANMRQIAKCSVSGTTLNITL